MGKAVSKFKTSIKRNRTNRVFALDNTMNQVFKEQKEGILLGPSNGIGTRIYIYEAFVLHPVDKIFPVDVHENRDTIMKIQLQLYYDSLEIQDTKDSMTVYKRYDFRSIKEWFNSTIDVHTVLNVVINEIDFTRQPILGIANSLSNVKILNPNNCINAKNIPNVKDHTDTDTYTLQLMFLTKHRMKNFTCDLLQHMYQYLYDVGMVTEETLENSLTEIETYRKKV